MTITFVQLTLCKKAVNFLHLMFRLIVKLCQELVYVPVITVQ